MDILRFMEQNIRPLAKKKDLRKKKCLQIFETIVN